MPPRILGFVLTSGYGLVSTDVVAIDGAAHQSAARRAVRRFLRHRGAVVGIVILSAMVAAVVVGPYLYTVDPNATNPANRFAPPSAEHPLGADRIGRDLLARLLDAGRVSLLVGLSSAVFATGIGLVLGLIAGGLGGRFDAIVMRAADVTLAIPALIAISLVVAILGAGVEIVIVFIAVFQWPEPARIVRATVLGLRGEDFVTAVIGMGGTRWRVIRHHLVFHVLGPLTVTGTFLVAVALLTEAALSYLGIGVRPPQASWGNMLFDAQQLFILRDHVWYWLPPGIAIFLTVLAVNLVGDGLRDAVDPRS